MSKVRESVKNGFTLIELTFAIAFVSILLVTVSLITQEIVKLYRKGYTIKTVNQVGRDIIDDITSSVTSSTVKTGSLCSYFSNNATARDACYEDDAQKLIYYEAFSSQDIYISTPGATNQTAKVPLYGVFCSGKHSYIWNTGYLYGDSYYIDDAHSSTLHQNRDNLDRYKKRTVNNEEYRLAKVEDPQNLICQHVFQEADVTDYNDDNNLLSKKFPTNFDLGKLGLNTEVTELISKSDASLAIYDLTIFPPAKASTGRLFLSGSFILGTIDGGINIMGNENFCQVPSGYMSIDFGYCAINKFNFSVSATGTGS